MNQEIKPRPTGRLIAILIAPVLALGIASGAFADEPSPSDEPKAILRQLAQNPDNNIVAIFTRRTTSSR